jgi:hypothetical protein
MNPPLKGSFGLFDSVSSTSVLTCISFVKSPWSFTGECLLTMGVCLCILLIFWLSIVVPLGVGWGQLKEEWVTCVIRWLIRDAYVQSHFISPFHFPWNKSIITRITQIKSTEPYQNQMGFVTRINQIHPTI